MCIRDRDADPVEQAGKLQFHRAIDDDADRAVLVVLADVGPVSYTHLRAHETVLDLVCRLLLEKKKHQPTTYTLHNILYDIYTHHSSNSHLSPSIDQIYLSS